MENIKRWFENENDYGYENYDITEYEGHLEARTKTVLFMVVEPHSGTDNRWMLRVTTTSAFDRWANSTAIEKFFDADIELCNYLYEHQLDIYKELLEYLSLEYDEIQQVIVFNADDVVEGNIPKDDSCKKYERGIIISNVLNLVSIDKTEV